MTYLVNVAGFNPAKCSETTREELAEAGIPVDERTWGDTYPGAVRGVLKGRVGEVTFERRWTYWEANGPVPYATAMKLWESPHQADIRVQGYVDSCHPKHFATGTGEGLFVFRYHLDSTEGMQAFAAILREDGVVE